MINKDYIQQLTEEKLSEGQFIVDIKISGSNVINITVDGMDGIKISKCVEISRNIEGNLDREEEDFELHVSSAGLGQPFTVHQQFVKNENKDIEVITKEGIKFEGKMINVTEQGFELEVSKKEKLEGKKKKQLVTTVHNFEYENIKEAKNIIKF